jgi:hypothetical protein
MLVMKGCGNVRVKFFGASPKVPWSVVTFTT